MKKKNLFQTVLFVIAFVMVNQFANAQTVTQTSIEQPIKNEPPAIIVACNCTKPGWGCFGGDEYCLMYCRMKCGTVTNPCTFTATVSPTLFYICQGSSVTLSASPSGSAYAYQWLANGTDIASATSQSYSTNVAATYTVRVTRISSACSHTSAGAVVSDNLIATISASTALVCKGNAVTLYAYPSGTSYSYQWMRNGTDILGATSESYSTKNTGAYSVKVTIVAGGCSSISADVAVSKGCRFANDNATSQSGEAPTFTAAPNPVSQSTTISFYLNQSKRISLRVFDLNGRLVKTLVEGDVNEGEHQIEWNIDEVNAGVYFLQYQSVDFSKMEKLIVTK